MLRDLAESKQIMSERVVPSLLVRGVHLDALHSDVESLVADTSALRLDAQRTVQGAALRQRVIGALVLTGVVALLVWLLMA